MSYILASRDRNRKQARRKANLSLILQSMSQLGNQLARNKLLEQQQKNFEAQQAMAQANSAAEQSRWDREMTMREGAQESEQAYRNQSLGLRQEDLALQRERAAQDQSRWERQQDWREEDAEQARKTRLSEQNQKAIEAWADRKLRRDIESGRQESFAQNREASSKQADARNSTMLMQAMIQAGARSQQGPKIPQWAARGLGVGAETEQLKKLRADYDSYSGTDLPNPEVMKHMAEQIQALETIEGARKGAPGMFGDMGAGVSGGMQQDPGPVNPMFQPDLYERIKANYPQFLAGDPLSNMVMRLIFPQLGMTDYQRGSVPELPQVNTGAFGTNPR